MCVQITNQKLLIKLCVLYNVVQDNQVMDDSKMHKLLAYCELMHYLMEAVSDLN